MWRIVKAREEDALWGAAGRLAADLEQTNWLQFRAEWHISNHLLVAVSDGQAIGLLRFVVQSIGPDMDCPEVMVNGAALTEAKIMAFGVANEWRRQGIGRALQESAIHHARLLGCYQVRSHSSGSSVANHRLKLAMGFAIHPLVRGDDRQGCYFLLPLQTSVP